MKKRERLIVSTFILAILCLTMLSPVVMGMEAPGVQISAKVDVSGAVPAVPEVFTIKMSAVELSSPMPAGSLNGVSTVLTDGTGNASFPAISFAKVGKHEYTVWQEAGTNIDCAYDTSIYHVTVMITNKEGGGLEATTVSYRNDETEKTPDISFTNMYTKPAPVSHDPPVEKVITGAGAPKNAAFTFQLKAVTPSAPMPEGAVDRIMTHTMTGSGHFEFGEIEFEDVGTYEYQLTELASTDKNFTYDKSIYTMTVRITREGKDLIKEVIYAKDGSPVQKVIFTNHYKAPDIPATGESNTFLPVLGAVMLLSGALLMIARKKIR